MTAVQPVEHPGVAVRAVSAIGAFVRRNLESLGRGSRFTVATVRALADVRTWAQEFSTHAVTLGVQSIPIGVFIALFTGVVLAMLSDYSVGEIVPPYFTGTLVQKTIMLELGPVLTGLALAGRVGANIAAELGTMKVTEQIDALETLSFDPLSYLVAPRVVAATVMFPVVVAAAMMAGVLSGWFASVSLLDIASQEFLKGLRIFFVTFDVRYGLIKSASFGAAVSLIGCHAGLRAEGGAQGVGRSATRAVVISASTILVLDALWAVLWLMGRSIR